MISLVPVLSTLPPTPRPTSRRSLLVGSAALALSGCSSVIVSPGPAIEAPELQSDAFVMPDGARLPYRTWLPEGRPTAVILALHGFNDSRDAWEIPAPSFAAAGMAVYAPDQRGFGAAPGRGFWPGAQALVDDAAEMTRLMHARHPGTPLYVMGESMGGAVIMRLATEPNPPDVAGYIMIAPAVWGRARMNVFLRSGLWLVANIAPGLKVTGGGPIRVTASDNRDALIRLSRDPLTIHETRFDTLRGLVNLMDGALAAGPHFAARGLFLYGDKDQLVPKEATAATWRSLPPEPVQRGRRLGFYENGYHLLLRDLDRHLPIKDVIAWMQDDVSPLPSGADAAAAKWLEAQT